MYFFDFLLHISINLSLSLSTLPPPRPFQPSEFDIIPEGHGYSLQKQKQALTNLHFKKVKMAVKQKKIW